MKCRRYMRKGIWAVVLLLAHVGIMAQVTEIWPEMEHEQITQVLQDARPGDTILFREGTYKGNYRLENLHGKVNRPIIIMGERSDRTTIDGEILPGATTNHNAFSLVNCTWISIEGFTIKNCWLDLVRAENSS